MMIKQHGINWALAEHITTPRIRCLDTPDGQAMLRRRRAEAARLERLMGITVAIGASSDTYAGLILEPSYRWRVAITHQGRPVRSKYNYENEEDAAREYDRIVRERGYNRPLNFPDEEQSA